MRIRRSFALIACATLAGMSMAEASPTPQGMALIPAGDYKPLIYSAGERESIPVPMFYLDTRPVTNEEFLAFVRAEPKWRRSKVSPLFAEPGYLADWAGDIELGARAPADSPVVRVSWFAAAAYARWRGRRLPTTAEWERAASAGFTTPTGTDEPAYRNATLQWLSEPTRAPLPAAGAGRPNFYGVRNLADLVWEWVDDFNAPLVSEDSRSESSPDRNFFCGSAAVGVRNFTDYPAFMRMAFRSSLRASYVVPDLGFRCALSP